MEDQAEVALFLTRALRAEGFLPDCTGTASQVPVLAREHRHEMVLLDLGRRPAEHRELLLYFQELQPDTKVMVVSAAADLATKLACFRLGVVDYLVKPYSIEELLARLRVHMHERRQGTMLLQAGPLTLDERSRRAELSGRVVPLQAREYQVLRYLMLHAGEVVSRQRLLSAVWGYDFDPHSNVVDVCVRRLRQHLGPDTPIETIRNAGYTIAISRANLEILSDSGA